MCVWQEENMKLIPLACRAIPADRPLVSHNSHWWSNYVFSSVLGCLIVVPSKETTNKKAMFLPIHAKFLPVIPMAPIASERAFLTHVLCLCSSSQADGARHVSPLWGWEMGRGLLHSCALTYCGHPVYLARLLRIGCGLSAHYWQLGRSPEEHAFPVTNIPNSNRSMCLSTRATESRAHPVSGLPQSPKGLATFPGRTF